MHPVSDSYPWPLVAPAEGAAAFLYDAFLHLPGPLWDGSVLWSAPTHSGLIASPNLLATASLLASCGLLYAPLHLKALCSRPEATLVQHAISRTDVATLGRVPIQETRRPSCGGPPSNPPPSR